MIPDEVPQASGSVFGHNSGSMLVQAKAEHAAALHDTPRDEGKTFAQRKAEFLASAAAQRVRDRQSAADAGDTIKMAGEIWALIDAERRRLSDPFRETHLALSAMASEFWEPVNDAMLALHQQIDAWTAAEDKRVAAIRREQEAELANLRKPTIDPEKERQAERAIDTSLGHAPRSFIDYSAPASTPAMSVMRPTKRAKIRGDLGATISQRDVVGYEIEDISLIPDHIMQSETVKAAILTVVKTTARHLGVPAGIRVITTSGNQIS
jgi:hypothetical protein